MDDERRPARTQQPTAGPMADQPLPELPGQPEPAGDEPDDEVVPGGHYEPL